MRIKDATAYVFLTLLMVGVTALIYAQSNGKIEGTITDKETGGPIIGATVQIIGTQKLAVTDQDGKFVIDDITPGSYDLTITHPDYITATVRAVTVKAGQATGVLPQLTKMFSSAEAVVTNRAGEVFIRGCREIADAAIAMKSQGFIPSPSLKKECDYLAVGSAYPPAHGGTAIVNGQAFDAMFFKNYGVNPFVDTEDDHFSTFAIDVDDASYIMARSYLDRGALPLDEAVRTEEFVNHFKYGYQAPREETFRLFFEGAPSRFGQNCQLLKIGIKGKEIEAKNRKDANLVFVVDVSGSMGREDRLGLVKKALRLLVDELTTNDRVGIVVYGSTGRVVMQPQSLENKSDIIRAIESLCPDGSTNAEEGIRLGYEMMDRIFEPRKINRIILCSDGVANVGRTGPEEILKEIKQYADKGITLSAVGFGMGNYNDILMEKLGNKGNGSYAYVDDISEAKRVFVDNLTGNLQVIARDVKIQVDFNPAVVRSYRLLGYENRDVEDAKFRDDTEDGGEVGAGHEVTALYEVKFKDNEVGGNVGTVYIRYKDPDDMAKVSEISENITGSMFRPSFENSSQSFKLAACVAEFSEILRKSYWAKGSKLDDVLSLAKELVAVSDSSDLIELMGMISKSQKFEEQLAQK